MELDGAFYDGPPTDTETQRLHLWTAQRVQALVACFLAKLSPSLIDQNFRYRPERYWWMSCAAQVRQFDLAEFGYTLLMLI